MITGQQLAQMGVELATGKRIDYDDVDCQAFVELIFDECGKDISYSGSNDMYRNACSWIGTIEEAKRIGYLVPGVALFIHSFNGGEPEKYRKDGKGNAEHVGLYVGENALEDTDKNGEWRICNVVHSSASMDRVAGSTLKNGWTHVGLWKQIDYGIQIQNSENGILENSMIGDEKMAIEESFIYATVKTANGSPLNFRTKKSTKADLVARVPEITNGARVKVLRDDGDWCKISYNGYNGYVLSEFLNFANTVKEEAEWVDQTIGDMDDKAKFYRVYVDFTTKDEALVFQKAMQGCQVGSVK